MKQLRKILSLFCALAMVLTFLSIPALAEETAFAGGSGTADAPWQIASVDQLAYLAATVNLYNSTSVAQREQVFRTPDAG